MSSDFSLVRMEQCTPPRLEPAPDIPSASSSPEPEPNEPSPDLPTFIHVTFFHPLHNERGYIIRTILHTFSRFLRERSLPRCTSILDLGCGEGSFLTRLHLADEDLPVENVTGIDVADDVEDPIVHKLLEPGGYANFTGEAWERWAPLEFKLYRGSFEALAGRDCYHDIVVCTEVVEHLDPGPLGKWGEVVLGDVKPRICVVTTPNREFNALFDILERKQPEMSRGLRYRWPGVEYECRHEDHRFEWTRPEFRSWATELGEKWGYEVMFQGVGGWGSGMGLAHVDDVPGELMKLAREVAGGEPPPMNPDYIPTELAKLFGDIRMHEDQNITNRVFGDCSQVAIFVRQPVTAAPGTYTPLVSTPDLKHTFTTSHPFSPDPQFPPKISSLVPHIVTHRTLRTFLPSLFDALWSMTVEDYTRVLDGYTRGLFRNCTGHEIEKRNRLMAKCAAKPCDVRVIETTVSVHDWWRLVNSGGPGAGRVCHWRDDIWLQVITSGGPQYHTLPGSPPEDPDNPRDPYANPIAWDRYRPHSIRTSTTPTAERPIFDPPDSEDGDEDDGIDGLSDISAASESASAYSRYSATASLAAWSDVPPPPAPLLMTEVVWNGGEFPSDVRDEEEGLLMLEEKKGIPQHEQVRVRFYRPEVFNDEEFEKVRDGWRRCQETLRMMEQVELDGGFAWARTEEPPALDRDSGGWVTEES